MSTGSPESNLNPKDLATAALRGFATLDEETVYEVGVAVAQNDASKVYDLIPRLAILPTAIWGAQRSRLLAKFGKGLSIRHLDQSIREEQAKSCLPKQPRNGASLIEGDWQAKILRSDADKMLPCYENVALFLQYHSEWQGVLGYNELTAGYEIRKRAPVPITAKEGTEIEDHFDTEATRWLEQHGLMVKPAAVRQVVDAVARENAYHPVRDYLENLPKWDGIRRAGSWLIDYCGVASSDENPNIYAMAVGEKFLISAIARVMEPGCKADHLLILEGEQGIGKSTAVRILAGPDWFTDQLDALGSQNASMQLRGVWIVELPELDVLGRAEMSRAKLFFSQQNERFRVPYGRRVIKVPRQCVFIGTTNHETWLKDETGGRRFWPVKCREIDLEGLKRDRDQIWAEALLRYGQGVHWWLEDAGVVRQAKAEQKSRYQEDPWQDPVMRAAEEIADVKGGVTVQEVLQRIGLDVSRQDQAAANRAARCLRVAGWEQYPQRKAGKVEHRYRAPKEPALVLEDEAK